MLGKLIEAGTDKFDSPPEQKYLTDGEEVVNYFQDDNAEAMSVDCIVIVRDAANIFI